MDAILNNPFRILGLEPTVDETIISGRVSEILMNISKGNKVTYPLDEFYDRILVNPFNTNYYNNLSSNIGNSISIRNMETVKIAYEKLQDPAKRNYYSVFAFECYNSFNESNVDEIIKVLESELQLKEKRNCSDRNMYDNYFFHNFLNLYSEEFKANYIILKEYNLLHIKNLTQYDSIIKPNVNLVIAEVLNFKIQYDCKWIEGDDNKSYSFFWGKHQSQNSYYCFGITGNGYMCISNIEDGKTIEDDWDFIGRQKSDFVNKYGQNHLELHKYDNYIEFYINNSLVHKTKTYKKFYQDSYGLIISGKQEVEFSNFKISYFKADLDFGSDFLITPENYLKTKNLIQLYFTKAFENTNVSYIQLKKDKGEFSKNYEPTIFRLHMDKALILFGKYFRSEILSFNGFFNETNNPVNEFNAISHVFLEDLLKGFRNSVYSENGLEFYQILERLEKYCDDFSENLFLYAKDLLIRLTENKEAQNNSFDYDFYRKSKINKTYFAGTFNNPFRVLGIKHNSTEKEIAKRISDLLIYSEIGKSIIYETDLFLGEIDRTPGNIREAIKIMDNPHQKLYYSMIWFIEENQADKDFLEKLGQFKNIEITEDIKLNLIGKTEYFIKKNIDYVNSINSIYVDFYWEASDKLRDLIDARIDTIVIDAKYDSEIIHFCIFDNITSVLPLIDNCKKIGNKIVVDSNSENGILLLKSLNFDNKVDYEIKFDCEWIDGEEYDKLYSIVFCKDAGSNFYQFGISANGHIYFDAVIGGIAQNIWGWHKDKNTSVS